jgi:imidazolonepropionase-like amidohydrolase
MAERLRVMLHSGYTTVRDAGGTDVGFEQAVQDGLIEGPRLIVSLPPLTQTGGHGDPRTRDERELPGEHGEFGMTHVVADGPDEVRKVVRENLRRGADVIKIMASGGAVSATGRIDSRQYSVPELAAAVEEADAAGSYVMAHALSSGAIRNCLAAGVQCIEHGNFLDAGTAKLVAAADASVVPTLLAYGYDAEHGARYGYSTEVQEKLRIGAERRREGLRHALEAGVRVGCGSDMIGDLVGIMGREIVLQAEVTGATRALLSATRVNAEILGVADRVGTIEPGKLADVIVVGGDPLVSPALLEGTAHIDALIKGGTVLRSRIH